MKNTFGLSLIASVCILLVSNAALAQGLELMPKESYKKLHSPPALCGASAGSSKLPEKYVIPANDFPSVGNQGQQSSCTAWATGYALMSYYQAKVNKWTIDDDHTFSPAYLYQNIKTCANCNCGTYISSALDFLKDNGNVSFNEFPYEAKSCKKPDLSLKNSASEYKIKGWLRIEDVNNLTDLKTYLSEGIPIVIASYTDDAFSNYYNKKENEVFHWKSGNYKGGAHAMLLVGYDNSLGAFKIMNSWGKNWGSSGFVWVDYDSFRTMVSEAYVVEKDYVMSDDNNTEPVVPVVKTEITADHFQLYGFSEEIHEGRYYFTYGIEIDEAIQNQVSKVVYVYDDPSFINKYATSTTKPNYTSSYEGWGCLNNMKAIVYFTDGSNLSLEFDGCSLIEEHANDSVDVYEVEIIPVVVAEPTEQEGRYDFKIQLRGIEHILDDIEKVVYDRNDPSFKQRYVTTYDRENNFEGGYNGWGCLYSLGVTIYYTDQTSDTFEINMCEELGW